MRDTRIPAIAGSGKLLDAALIGLPDAVACAWCLWVWLDPLAMGVDAVRTVVLMMLLEFILLNATGFFTALQFMSQLRRLTRIAMLLGLCLLYILLVAGFAMPFHALWPYFAFGWLALGKLAWIARNRRTDDNEQMWLMGGWAISVAAYLVAVGVGVTTSLPVLGITPELVPQLHLPNGGQWVDMPHKAVASAVFYFGTVAIFKWVYLAARKIQPRSTQRAGVTSDA